MIAKTIENRALAGGRLPRPLGSRQRSESAEGLHVSSSVGAPNCGTENVSMTTEEVVPFRKWEVA